MAAAKETKLPGSVIVETVITSFSLNWRPVAGEPPTVSIDCGASYADHTYLTDEDGNKVKLLLQNENAKFLPLTQDQINAIVPSALFDALNAAVKTELDKLVK